MYACYMLLAMPVRIITFGACSHTHICVCLLHVCFLFAMPVRLFLFVMPVHMPCLLGSLRHSLCACSLRVLGSVSLGDANRDRNRNFWAELRRSDFSIAHWRYVGTGYEHPSEQTFLFFFILFGLFFLSYFPIICMFPLICISSIACFPLHIA